MVAYCTVKAAVLNMTRAIAVDCAPHGIHVNCIVLAPRATPMFSEWLDSSEHPES